jgi:DNA (cytosine-5)-methyltransferase 1
MVHGDLFSGIGGFSLAARWMGWRTAWFSEIDPFASRVLAHHWPDVPNYGDITRIDWATVEPVDILTAGFPCQPHSLAGKRAGSNDDRDLFDEIIRCAGVLRPRTIVLENVPGLFTSDDGRFFGRILGALAESGYDAEWRVLSAADVGAPHKRERVWIVADATGERREGRERGGAAGAARRANGHTGERGESLVYRDSGRREQRLARFGEPAVVSEGHVPMGDAGRTRRATRVSGSHNGQERIASERDHGSDVLHWRDAMPVRGSDNTVRFIPREAAQGGPQSAIWPVAHGVSGRVAQLRGIGNAIVPQCACQIFQHLDAASRRTETR